MKSWKLQYFRACDGFKVLKMPYKQGEDKRIFSLYMFLPALADRVCSDSGFINKHYPRLKRPLREFCIPKLKIDFSLDATSLLKNVGLELLFGDGVLTEMVDSCLPLDGLRMYQKSFIELNEEGTEAAGFSVMCGGGPGGLPEVNRFVADHPFLFIIREESSQVVVFIGQLLNPLAA